MFILEKHEADERGKRIDIERTKHFFGRAIRRRC